MRVRSESESECEKSKRTENGGKPRLYSREGGRSTVPGERKKYKGRLKYREDRVQRRTKYKEYPMDKVPWKLEIQYGIDIFQEDPMIPILAYRFFSI